MSAGGQASTGARQDSGRDMAAIVKRSPGIADLATVTARAVTRAVTRAVARPMDYQGGERLRLTAEKHDGRSCAPAGPGAMYSGSVQKYLRFPLDSCTRGIIFSPSAGDAARRNLTKNETDP
jgi:hypothetical protein